MCLKGAVELSSHVTRTTLGDHSEVCTGEMCVGFIEHMTVT